LYCSNGFVNSISRPFSSSQVEKLGAVEKIDGNASVFLSHSGQYLFVLSKLTSTYLLFNLSNWSIISEGKALDIVLASDSDTFAIIEPIDKEPRGSRLRGSMKRTKSVKSVNSIRTGTNTSHNPPTVDKAPLSDVTLVPSKIVIKKIENNEVSTINSIEPDVQQQFSSILGGSLLGIVSNSNLKK